MANTETPAGMVKKEMMFLAVLIALVAGFLGGVIYSSFKNPVQIAGQGGSPAGGGQQSGLSEDQARTIFQLEQEVAANPDNVGAWTNLGHVYFDTNQITKAINAYTKSLELNPQQAEVLTDLGVMYRRNNQPQEAIKAFDRAISLNPTLEQARFNKGIVLIYDLNDKPAGLKTWEDLLAVNPAARAPNGQPLQELIEANK
jgi:cytochrome c-type biogenesis protein CcmH/NrfG